jgi:hypothetical protein
MNLWHWQNPRHKQNFCSNRETQVNGSPVPNNSPGMDYYQPDRLIGEIPGQHP